MLCILDNKLQSISNPDVSIKSSGSAADADVDDNDIDYQNIFIEDDMIVPVKTEDIKTDKDIERTHLNAVKEPKRLWPKDHRSGEVRIPYVIDRGYSKCFFTRVKFLFHTSRRDKQRSYVLVNGDDQQVHVHSL